MTTTAPDLRRDGVCAPRPWLAPPFTDVAFTPEDLRAAGADGGGVAALAVLPRRACGLAETARVVRYLAAESARQCGPCMFGLPALADEMTKLAVVGGGPATRVCSSS